MGNGERFSLTLKTLVRRQNSTRKTPKQNDVPGERKKAFQSVRPMMTCLFPQFHPQVFKANRYFTEVISCSAEATLDNLFF